MKIWKNFGNFEKKKKNWKFDEKLLKSTKGFGIKKKLEVLKKKLKIWKF